MKEYRQNPFQILDKTKIKDRFIEGFKDKFFWGEIFSYLPLYKKREFLNSYIFYLTLLIFYFSLIFLLLIKFQIIEYSHYFSLAYGNRIRITPLDAPRGLIYDKNGEILAKNIPKFSIYIHKSEIKKQDLEKIKKLLISNIPECTDNLEDFFENNNFEYRNICKGISYEKALKLEILFRDYPQIELLETPIRKYECTKECAHIIGYVSKISKEEYKNYKDKEYSINDFIGKQGIEKYYEQILKGKKGFKKIEVDRLGIERRVLEEVSPKIGSSLILTIDRNLQEKAYKIIKSYANKKELEGASFIALNPNTGEILVLISYPSFDPNIFLDLNKKQEVKKVLNDKRYPLFNRAIQGTYPPGSIFKLIVGAAALEEGIINPNFTVISSGGIKIGKWFFPDWLPQGHGKVNFYQAIANSVNTYFYIIGGGYKNFKGLGLEKIVEYSKKFGLSKKTGIDLPDEASGFLPSREWKERVKKEKWYIGDTYHLSIGQGDILVTPLQIALWTSVFANSGKLVRPHLVKEIVDSKGNIKKIQPEIINSNVISKEAVLAVKKGMILAVKKGTARSLLILKKLAGAKTGTSQFSLKEKPHGVFTAFYPADNPKIVVTVLTEKSGKSYSNIKIVRDFLVEYEKEYTILSKK